MNPSISRDGRWVYYASNRGRKSQIWRAPLAGGVAEAMTVDEAFSAEESADGGSLYYGTRAGISKMSLGDRRSGEFWKGIPTANFQVTADGIYYEGLAGGAGVSERFPDSWVVHGARPRLFVDGVAAGAVKY